MIISKVSSTNILGWVDKFGNYKLVCGLFLGSMITEYCDERYS